MLCVDCEQVDADAFAAVCLEPYSRGRILAAYSSSPSQDAEAEAAAPGGIATIDVGTNKVLSKVCRRPLCQSRGMLSEWFGTRFVLSRSEAALAG